MNKEIMLAYTQKKRQTNGKYPQNKVNMEKNMNNSKKNNNSKYPQTRMNTSIKRLNSE